MRRLLTHIDEYNAALCNPETKAAELQKMLNNLSEKVVQYYKQMTTSEREANVDALQTIRTLISKERVRTNLAFRATTFKEFLQEQTDYQALAKERKLAGTFTTVGFEHEFANVLGHLQGLTHLEISASQDVMPYTGQPFRLETDGANALELVHPPYIMATTNANRPVPVSHDMEKLDRLIREFLGEIVPASGGTLGQLCRKFGSELDIQFSLESVKVRPVNLGTRALGKFGTGAGLSSTISGKNLENEGIKSIKKQGVGIIAQANLATDAREYARMQGKSEKSNKGYVAIYNDVAANMRSAMQLEHGEASGLPIFLDCLADALSGQIAVPLIKKRKQIQQLMFEKAPKEIENLLIQMEGKATPQKVKSVLSVLIVSENRDAAVTALEKHIRQANRQDFFDAAYEALGLQAGWQSELRFATMMSTSVKDVGGVWLKDNIFNVGLGLLDRKEWEQVRELLDNKVVQEKILNSLNDIAKGNYENTINEWHQQPVEQIAADAKRCVGISIGFIKQMIDEEIIPALNEGTASDIHLGPQERVKFLGHEEKWIGPRQDTYLNGDSIQNPAKTSGFSRLHVVETRSGVISEDLRMLE